MEASEVIFLVRVLFFLFLGGSQCHAGAFSCLRTVCATFLALSSAGLFSQQIKIVSGYNR